MGSSVTIELSADIEAKLTRLAEATRQSRTELVDAALSSYVEHELRAVDGIKQGLADITNGDLVDHEEAMAELDAVIDAANVPRL
jgi:predicted transcriptional regulator